MTFLLILKEKTVMDGRRLTCVNITVHGTGQEDTGVL